MAKPGMLDIRSVKDQVSAEEWQARVDLAAAYRMMAYMGWDDLIYTHLSMRIPGTDHHFLINPLGLMFEEITASSLVKVDLNGNQLMDTPFIPNAAGFVIHSAIHEARDDANCVMHLHTDYGIAVSNQKDGLLPMCQTSIVPWAMVAYHDYEGFAVNDGEKERLVADFGTKNALILRNHGTLTVGDTVAKAFEAMWFLERACKIQVLTQSTGAAIYKPSQESIDNALRDLRVVAGANGADNFVWPAILRKMERLDPSFRD
ncbi:class II aldolase/adducin family protein [Kordiimonas lacus]|uniref:Ribulose-5-phosphate 4-epimerase/Fuculose-1-phosphate aldolase n=1 Tax=Kordiimonas lacus TaxID=637679 RepID=A0A1G7CJQ2_9PROT|nr:class II aldolase/adducin family protein [Kordiimonas lacus]SDE38665.1 Ribulose-5-phosphate 4-epimerase/Fuculose-1-phosphate aldolase [Kordiimonas lacus]